MDADARIEISIICDLYHPRTRSWIRRLNQEEKAKVSAAPDGIRFLPFSVCRTLRLSIYSSAAFWKANLTGESSPFLKLDRWIIMINATPLFMSIQT